MSFTILSALSWWARAAPQQTALNVDGAAWTFAELHEKARCAGARLAELGVKPGDRVALLATHALSYYAVALGAQWIGAIAAPLNIRYTPRELKTALADTAPTVLFVDSERFNLASQAVSVSGPPVMVALEEVENWRHLPAAPFEHRPRREDLVALMSTSGSTATPKFVQFTHDMVVSTGVELQLIEPSTRQGRMLLLAPPFSGGLYTVWKHLVIGSTVFLRSRFDPEDVMDLLVQEKINVFPTAPVFLEQLQATAQFRDADLSFLTWASVGGARVSPDLVKTWRDKGVLLRCLYGQTEAGAAWSATDKALEDPMQAGYAGPFTDWRVVKDGRFAEPGEIGEIVISGPSVTPGYWENREATAEILQDGWLRTGDLGVQDETGSLTFIDRIKDIIISGGLNISAAEIEQVISEIRGVAEVAVIAAADAKFGETPLAVIYGSKGLDPREVIRHCDRNLSNYKVPRYVALESEPLPRLATGKISKPLLRERYADAAQRLPKLR